MNPGWRSRALGGTWRVAVAGLLFAAGLVATRLAFARTEWSPLRMPGQAPEEVAGWYLLGGSLALAAGLAPAARGLVAGAFTRFLVLSALVGMGFAVGTTLEASIYSSTVGMGRTMALLVPPSLILAGTLALLFEGGEGEGLRGIRDRRALRLTGAVLAFPAIYFLFGVLVSPVVSGYYEEGVAVLTLPDPGLMASTEVLRGAFHLLAALPVVHFWRGSRRSLALALGSAFFVSVAAWDFVLAYQMPLVLVLVHGAEVLAGSLVYGWVVAVLLVRQEGVGNGELATSLSSETGADS